MTKKSQKPATEMNYEEAVLELRSVVERLETEELDLDISLELFERGQALAKRCNELLEGAELKLKQLISDEEGEFEETDLEGNEE